MAEKSAEANSSTTKFGDYDSFAAYQMAVLRAIMEVTKAANSLPNPGQDHEYYSSFPLFRQVMKAEGDKILSILSTITAQQVGKRNLFQANTTDTEEKIDLLTEVNDVLLERAAIQMDIAKGVKKDSDIQLTAVSKQIDTIWNKKNERLKRDSSVTLLTATNVTRPQVSFPDKIDNSNTPFVPKIKEKPHAQKPLAILLETVDGEETYSHPYEVEIEVFSPTEQQMAPRVKNPLPLSDTPLVMVDSVPTLQQMIEELGKENAIAMDLEHHSFRSFQGFTCLIQISTWNKDFIVDPLILRGELHILNEVTTNPKIVKVLHGSHSDVLWLQRDFGVYIVNLFDTGMAAKLLNYERLSLSYLLKRYAEVESDKRFQLVDWRIRPLPQEMVNYARTDTHYLLFIYERLKEDLISSSNSSLNLLKATWDRSSQICLKRYEKPLLNDASHLNLIKVCNKRFNDRQKYALKHIYAWRDNLARQEDESTAYVLPNHMLLHICELLPREMQGIVACCNPCPPLVKQQLNELHQIILKAREIQLVNPLLNAPKIDIPLPTLHSIDFDNILHVIHDTPAGGADQHDDTRLPTLIDDNGDLVKDFANDLTITVPRLKSSSFLPPKREPVKRCRLPSKVYVTEDGTILRTVTPFERYTKQLEQLELEQNSIDALLAESRSVAEQMVKEEKEEVKTEPQSEEMNTSEPKESHQLDPDVPMVIRGKSKQKRKQDQSEAGSSQDDKAKKKQRNAEKCLQNFEEFDYKAAINEQRNFKRQHNGPQEQRRGGHSFNRGRGRGRFHPTERKRKQFDDMEDLAATQSGQGQGSLRGAKKRKFRGGNRSAIVRGSGSQHRGRAR